MPLEARDASGNRISAGHIEAVTASLPVVLAFFATGVLAAVATYAAAAAGGVLGWLGAVVGALVALLALGTFGFTVYGRYAGMPFLFTK